MLEQEKIVSLTALDHLALELFLEPESGAVILTRKASNLKRAFVHLRL
jgi:hypothetical protein